LSFANGSEFEDVRARIERLEDEAERVRDLAESCRKAMLLAKAAMTAGAAALLATLTGLVHLPASAAIVSVGAIVGGVVWFGSNHATRAEALARLGDIEAERRRAIDALDFRGATIH
jgi:hypothetical protein